MAASDEQLMGQVQQGDEGAFLELVARHRDGVLNFLARFTGDADRAQDLSQEVFVRLWRSAATYLPVAKFTTFLYTLARNVGLNDQARRDPLHGARSLEEPTGVEGEVVPLREALADPSPDPLRQSLATELRAQIRAALAALPPEQRLVFVLSETQGWSYEDIAVLAQCPVGTVASRKHAAVQKLRERLRPYLEESDDPC